MNGRNIRLVEREVLIVPPAEAAYYKSLTIARSPLIELRRVPFGIEHVEVFGSTVGVHMTVRDRDAGNLLNLRFAFDFAGMNGTAFADGFGCPPILPRRDLLAPAVRTALHEALCHEIDECLYIDGVRRFDPHDPAERLGFRR